MAKQSSTFTGTLDREAVDKGYKAAASDRKAVVRRVEEAEVLSRAEVSAQDARAMADGILDQVARSLVSAEIGKFNALVAGIGLRAIKDIVPHGEWTDLVNQKFPNRNERTLRRYQKNADAFLLQRGLTAIDAWKKLSAIDYALMSRSAGQLLLGDGAQGEEPPLRKKDIPSIVLQMAEHLSPPEGEDEAPEAGKPKDRPLSPAEKQDAAKGTWDKVIANVTQEAITRQSWALLSPEDQETAASALRTAADIISKSLRKAPKGKGV